MPKYYELLAQQKYKPRAIKISAATLKKSIEDRIRLFQAMLDADLPEDVDVNNFPDLIKHLGLPDGQKRIDDNTENIRALEKATGTEFHPEAEGFFDVVVECGAANTADTAQNLSFITMLVTAEELSGAEPEMAFVELAVAYADKVMQHRMQRG